DRRRARRARPREGSSGDCVKACSVMAYLPCSTVACRAIRVTIGRSTANVIHSELEWHTMTSNREKRHDFRLEFGRKFVRIRRKTDAVIKELFTVRAEWQRAQAAPPRQVSAKRH